MAQTGVAVNFNPRSPHGERRKLFRRKLFAALFQSTLPARGATRDYRRRRAIYHISIHAPRTGSDDYLCGLSDNPQDFNPRSPHGERLTPLFFGFHHIRYFNPRSPHGERHVCGEYYITYGNFNPRSPHGERREFDFTDIYTAEFQSTLPARGATWSAFDAGRDTAISIHAPRTGSDIRSKNNRNYTSCISIHAPRTGSDVRSQ